MMKRMMMNLVRNEFFFNVHFLTILFQMPVVLIIVLIGKFSDNYLSHNHQPLMSEQRAIS